MGDHRLRITSDAITRRGRRIRYGCPDCDARGDLTAPRSKVMELFQLLYEGHRGQAVSPPPA